MIEPLDLSGEYLEKYNEIVRPGFIFSVTRYFVERWVRVLGPGQAWMIVTLRQTCYWNKQQDWCIVPADKLGEWIGCSRATIHNYLNEPSTSWFVRKDGDTGYQSGGDRAKKNPNRYKVALDDPLTPGDADHLAIWLQDYVLSNNCDAITAVQAALAAPRSFLLAAALTRTDILPQRALSIQNLVKRALPKRLPTGKEDRVLLAELCDHLYSHIVQPADQFITSQYFRMNWVPKMRPSLSWLILWLRNKCWYDPTTGNYRDTSWVKDRQTVADVVSATPTSLRRWIQKAPPGWIEIVEEKKGRDKSDPQLVAVRFRVALRDQLTPKDYNRYQALLGDSDTEAQTRSATILDTQRKGSATKFDIQRSGSQTNFDILDQGSVTNLDPHPGTSATKFDDHEGSTTILDASDQGSATIFDRKEVFIKQSIREKIRNQQQLQPNTAVAVALSCKDWLAAYKINDPAYSQILQLQPDRIVVVGWLLFVEAQSWPDNPSGVVVKGLVENRQLPFPFALLANLTFAQWQRFANSPGDVPVAEQPLLELWAQVYRDAPIPWGLGEQDEIEHKSVPEAIEKAQPPEEHQWEQVLDVLKLQIPRATFEAWVQNTRLLSTDDGTWVVECPSPEGSAWLDFRLRPVITQVASDFIGHEVAFQFC